VRRAGVRSVRVGSVLESGTVVRRDEKYPQPRNLPTEVDEVNSFQESVQSWIDTNALACEVYAVLRSIQYI
jgi:uridine phosphorylase